MVQTCLYHEVDVPVLLVDAESESGDSREDVEFLTKSWQILRSLKDENGSRKSNYVRKIRFFIQSAPDEGKSEGIRTTVPHLISTFFQLAPNISSVMFLTTWIPTSGTLQALGRLSGIKELIVRSLEGQQVGELTECCPELRRLQVGDVNRFRSRHPAWESQLVNLEWLDLCGAFHSIPPPFIDENVETIRELRIGYEATAHIDFSQLQQLRILHLYTNWHNSPHKKASLESARELSVKFWRSIDEIPALGTLSFEGSKLYGHFEEAYFGVVNSYVVHKKPRLAKTLRTMRFGEWFPLDRFYSLVGWPMSKGLRRIVVPAPMKGPEAKQEERDKLRSVTELSDALGLEVFLADTI